MSYQSIGVWLNINKHYDYGPSLSAEFALDSRNIWDLRVEDFVQRAGPSTIGDLTGKVYGHGTYAGVSTVLKTVEVSSVSASGPWTEITPDVSDPAHVFPTTADADGEAFNLVVEPNEFVASQLWFRVTVTFGGGAGDYADIEGPFAWDPNIVVDPPASITVPANDDDGDYQISWDAVSGASSYELQEATQADFSGASTVHNGAAIFKDLTGRAEGTYYYRVRAISGAGQSAWTTGSNPCIVEFPALKVTPDLGWADRSDMLDASTNPRVASWALSGLQQVATVPVYNKTRNTLVFEYNGVKYKVDPGDVRMLGGSVKHYWRVASGLIQDFVLDLSVPRPKRTAGIAVTVPRILS